MSERTDLDPSGQTGSFQLFVTSRPGKAQVLGRAGFGVGERRSLGDHPLPVAHHGGNSLQPVDLRPKSEGQLRRAAQHAKALAFQLENEPKAGREDREYKFAPSSG